MAQKWKEIKVKKKKKNALKENEISRRILFKDFLSDLQNT